jgi:hypothetical protein
MIDEERVADSITRYLIGDSTQALKELELLKYSLLGVSNNANSTKDYNGFFKKTYNRILKIVKQ